jgi:lysophospholipase L1-like esterase
MKKIIFSIIVFIIVFLIYYSNITDKIYYFSVGDYLSLGINNLNKIENNYSENIKKNKKVSKYINYSKTDYRLMDLINDINYNKKIKYNNKTYNMQNILVKANYITISIGMNDIVYKKSITYEYVDELLKDIENLFILIRKYNKDKIDFLGYYNLINNNDLIEYTNKRLKKLCDKNNINYIDISLLNKYITSCCYPNNLGYQYITDQILNFTK